MLKFINMAHLPSLQRSRFQLGSASALSLPLCSSLAAGFLALLLRSFGLVRFGQLTSVFSVVPRSWHSLRYNQAFKRTAPKPLWVLQRQLAGRRLTPRYSGKDAKA
ncbi:hypothetical protein [Hydrocarboniphaga sp.]|uniref:hypothetical protein n=1 Tax=Hydrocarboniphaga sp. TaxID=2033016 RepID=UPI002AB837A6|nr:hypothetical protein [Hydrocarboniphaga sp.]MDZ4076944.1 hypothetical protein [Hydrocarboniphaga sp.]